MTLHRFAFIVKAPGYSAAQHQTALVSPQFLTRVVGVADFDQAVSAARGLIDEGIQLIELCGGFTQSEAAELARQTGHRIPVGVVVYTPEQALALAQLLA